MVREVDVCGQKYVINKVDKISDESQEDGHEILGDTFFKRGEIQIRSDLSPYIERQTLLHELLHAVLFCAGCYDIYDSENDIQAMATQLLYILRKNKGLVEYLTQEETNDNL